MPVEVLGLNGAPAAGDRLGVVENEAHAREISDYRQRLAREMAVARQAGSRGSLEQMMSQLQTTELSEAAVVIKADVQGSAEAIAQSLTNLNTDEVDLLLDQTELSDRFWVIQNKRVGHV